MKIIEKAATNHSWPKDIMVLLGGMALLAMVVQYTTLAKFAVLSPGAGFVTWSAFWQRVAAEVPLTWVDAILPVLMLFMGIWVLRIEFRSARLTQLLSLVVATDTRALIGLFIGCLLLVRYYFAPGQLAWGGDAAEHILYTWIASRSFAAGEWPIWTNYLAGGSPYLQFYGFLFYYLAGAVDLFFDDVFSSIKLVGGLAHALSGPVMYLLVRAATRSRLAALVAGLAYVLSFWHGQQIIVMGRWPLSLFYLLLPLPFFAFELARLSLYRIPAMIGGGLALACLAFTHPGYGFWAMAFYIFYIGLRTVRYWRHLRGRQWLYCGAGILAIGLVCGAYLTLPMWLEREFTGLEGGVSLSGVADPGWRQLLLWSNFRWRFDVLPVDQQHWYGGYLGLSLVIVTMAGLMTVKWRMHGPVCATGAGLVVSLILVLGYRWLENLPMVASLNAGRYLLFTVFFLAYSTAAAVVVLSRIPALRAWGPRLFSAVIVLILVDLGPTTFQHPYLDRNDLSPVGYPVELMEDFANKTRKLPEGELPGYRLFPTTDKVHPFSAIGWLVFTTGIPHMHSLFMEAPEASRRMLDPWRKMFEVELDNMTSADALHTHPDYEFIYGGAILHNLRYLLTVQAQGRGLNHRYIRMGWADSSPLLVAPKVMPFPSAEFAVARESGAMEQMVRATFPQRTDIATLLDLFPTLWTIRIMAAVPERLRCDVVLLKEGGFNQDLRTDPDVELIEHRLWNQRVAIRMKTDAACYARLAYAYYPYLRVLVDGIEVAAWPTAGGFIAIELSPGEHLIELVPFLSPLRKGMLGMLLVLLGLGGAILWRWHRTLPKVARQPMSV